ncbi:MAG: ABC transporter ATP-binding protein [Cyclobacteriaceae bacterium]
MCVLLETKSLSVNYPESQQSALKEINLSIAEGHIISLVGESGSGKTTLLKTLAGLLEPTEGKVLFDGNPLPPPSRRLVPGHADIRMVFQDFGLSPNLSVYENLWHVLRAYNREYRQERIAELLARCRLSGLEHQYPQTLSGGEKQRLALARALAEEPRVLLMDEPFGQLDALLKQQLKFEIAEFLEESSMTMVMVTHEPRDALGIADTIAVLKAGQLVQLASPQQIYQHPGTPYVAQLFGIITILPTKQYRSWYPALSKSDSPWMGIRAESVRLIPAERINNPRTGVSATEVSGVVQQVSYQGFYQEIIVQLSNNQLVTAFHQGPTLSVGEAVTVIIDPADLIPFSSET